MRLVSVYGVWRTAVRQLPSEELPPDCSPVVLKHFLGCVRFDAWHPPLKPGWVSVGTPPGER